VPFIVISGLHNHKYIDATHWYATFAMIVLPLNSVINPLIYEDSTRLFTWKKLKEFGNFIRNTRFLNLMIQVVQSCNVGRADEVTHELQVLQTVQRTEPLKSQVSEPIQIVQGSITKNPPGDYYDPDNTD
jgi:hypothetical protein